MRQNYISDHVRLLIFAASVIVACLICYMAYTVSNTGKSSVLAGSDQIYAMHSEFSNSKFAIYDGATILGSELVNIIKKAVDQKEHLSVVVRTLESSRTDYNYVYDEVTSSLLEIGTTKLESSKAQGAYINRSAKFLGSIRKDDNGNIICIWFDQQP
ncbi:hypothetical protein H0486_06485 [Lachnospiraceae bacterium MD1]|jgi:hypothetical protein|uniref:Uncharacterized protein n=1 Tax=Variimorphobacter saccharofermentans TaxID=2755051 RepID=A0A839JZ75_9FIRM|nr:hypothetical protein [Variimorphobacter saccharofermentans]MBB2182517.1 hypothetical protein [Variimorphobacter saccharofermentans]